MTTGLSRKMRATLAAHDAAWARLEGAQALLRLARHGGWLWSKAGPDGRRSRAYVPPCGNARRLAELEAYVADLTQAAP